MHFRKQIHDKCLPSEPPPHYSPGSIRYGKTHRFVITGKNEHEKVVDYKFYVIVNTYEDGRLAEIATRVAKHGDRLGSMLNGWCIAVTMLLQTGVPIAEIAKMFENMDFEPHGLTRTSEIPFAKSVYDYIIKWIKLRFPDQFPNEEDDAEVRTV